MTDSERDAEMVLHAPFNIVRGFSARLGTLDNGMRTIILEIRYGSLPEETVEEVTLLWDEELTSKLAARLNGLIESEREPPTRQ